MNVKMLLFPFSLVIALAAGIMYVQPSYREMQTKKAEAEQKTMISESVGQKVRNAQSLEKDLDAHKTEETAVLKYLSESRDDDRIVDTTNYLASQNNLFLTSLKIAKTDDSNEDESLSITMNGGIFPPAEPSAMNDVSDPTSPLMADDTGMMLQSAPAMTAKSKLLEVDMNLVGSYENIRSFVVKLSQTDRFQELTSIHINRSSGGDDTDSNILNAVVSLKITYLPFVKTGGSAQSPVFDRSQFQYETAAKLSQSITASTPPLNANATGAQNPFLFQ